MPRDAVDLQIEPVSPDEARAELELILQSPALDRSERLQKFLRYICDLTLNGEGSRINEYLIGCEVFHKGEDYNPGEDSVVRRQAHALRRKLEDYYAKEGRERPIRIELPVGRYVPAFRRIETVSASAASPPIETARAVESLLPEAGLRMSSTWKWIAVAGSLGLFALGALFGRLALSPKTAVGVNVGGLGPAAIEIWNPWLGSASPAVICLSNPSAAWVKRLDQPPNSVNHPPRFALPPDLDPVLRNALRLPLGGQVYFTPSTNAAKMGEAVAGVFLSQFLARGGKQVSATQSRFVGWEDLRRQNFIVLGNNESNQWIDPFLKKYPFRLGNTLAHEPRSIVNQQPIPGEQAVYRIAYSGTESEADQEYALVSMVAGLEGDTQLLLIDGLNTQATQMAAEYLTTEASLKELVNRLRATEPNHSGPWRFQAVLKTEVYDNVPTRAALITVRVLKS
jgi:hypothetical protein